MTDANVSVRLSHAHSNVEPYRYASLTIEDSESGTKIADIQLSIEEVYNLISNSSAKGTGFVMSPERAALIGKIIHVEKITIPAEFTKYNSYSAGEKGQPSMEMKVWAQKYIENMGWHSFRWTRHNYGWGLAGTWYEDKHAEVVGQERE